MQRRRHGQYLRAFPARMSFPRGNPFAGFEFSVSGYVGFLFWRTIGKKKPGIKAARAEWRRQPTAGKGEIARVQMKIVMAQKCRPDHPLRFQIIEHGCALALRHSIGAASE